MSRGFLVLAQNTDTVNYVEQAYALALSIKVSQKEVTSISVITNDPIPDHYKNVFDQIIPIPWIGTTTTKLKTENRWKLFHVTPYDETIVLDTDMLMLDDITSWWNYCSNHDLKFCSSVVNYKQDKITKDVFHRKVFISNNLPNPYFACHYFKKSNLAYSFYKVLETISNNWELFYGKIAPISYQKWPSMDLSAAIAIEMMGVHEQVIDICSPLEFTHMKPNLQDWPRPTEKWMDSVPYSLNSNGDFLVGNIKQHYLFHYVDKGFISQSIIDKLEALVNEQ